jgi:hypothetical protein
MTRSAIELRASRERSIAGVDSVMRRPPARKRREREDGPPFARGASARPLIDYFASAALCSAHACATIARSSGASFGRSFITRSKKGRDLIKEAKGLK